MKSRVRLVGEVKMVLIA